MADGRWESFTQVDQRHKGELASEKILRYFLELNDSLQPTPALSFSETCPNGFVLVRWKDFFHSLRDGFKWLWGRPHDIITIDE